MIEKWTTPWVLEECDSVAIGRTVQLVITLASLAFGAFGVGVCIERSSLVALDAIQQQHISVSCTCCKKP